MTPNPPAPVLYECYEGQCPRCGCASVKDHGPYDYIPGVDDALGGPPDPRVHQMECLGCGKPFDVAPADVAREIEAKQHAAADEWARLHPRRRWS